MSPASFHVVVYAKYRGQDDADVLCEGVLEKPASKTEEGDSVEGVIRQTVNYKCSGNESDTDGCTRNHAHALERVRVRQWNDSGRMGVICRKYHPLVAKGEASPGKDFRASWDDVEVQVQVRKIVDDNPEEGTSITPAELLGLQKELAPRVQRAEWRMRIRSALSQFEDVQVSAAKDQVEALGRELTDLPAKEEIQRAIHFANAHIQKIFTEAQEKERELLNQPKLDANEPKNFQTVLQQLQPKFLEAFAPLEDLKKRFQHVVDGQNSIREGLNAIGQVQSRMNELGEELPGLQWDDTQLLRFQNDLHRLLLETQADDALQKVDRLCARSNEIADEFEAEAQRLIGVVEAERLKKRQFDHRVETYDTWRSDPDKGLEEIEHYLEACGGLPEFPLRYWKNAAKKLPGALGDLPALPELSYHLPASQKVLKKSEEGLAPIARFWRELKENVAARVEGLYRSVDSGDKPFVPPTAWIEVHRVVNAQAYEVMFHLLANDERRMVIALEHGEPVQVIQYLSLSERGERKAVRLTVTSPVGIRVIGVAEEDDLARGVEGAQRPEQGAPRERVNAQGIPMERVNVRSMEIPIDRAGATKYVYPNRFTAFEVEDRNRRMMFNEQPAYRADRVFKQRVPGLD